MLQGIFSVNILQFRRETLEEAGICVELDGILRMEFMFGRNQVRFRTIFSGNLKDKTEVLKQVADKETYGAAWLSMSEIEGIGRGDAEVIKKIKKLPHRITQTEEGSDINKKKEKLRCGEVISLFTWMTNKTYVFNMKLLKTVKGEVFPNKFKSSAVFSTGLVVFDSLSKRYMLEKTTNSFTMPFKTLTELRYLDFLDFGNELLKEYFPLIQSTQKSKKRLSFSGFTKRSNKNLDGICGILHEAPKDKSCFGRIHVSYFISMEVKYPSNKFEWFLAKEVAGNSKIHNETKRVIKNHSENIVAPVEFLAREGSQYKKIEKL